jgi:hypothetical protein
MRLSKRALALTAYGPLAVLACGGQIAIGGEEPADGGTRDGRAVVSGEDASSHEGGGVAPEAGGAPQTVAITTDPYSIAPNQEAYLCQVFANPFGRDVDIVSISASAAVPGPLYEVAVFSIAPATGPTTPTPLEVCASPSAPLGTQPSIYVSGQVPSGTWPTMTYPEPNMGYRLAAHNALMIQAYYLNTTDMPSRVTTTISLTAASPGAVTTYVGNILLVNQSFALAATVSSTRPVTETKTWTPPSGTFVQNYHIFGSLGVPVPFQNTVRVSSKGMIFYEDAASTEATEQFYEHMPPLQMGPTDSITWSCTFYRMSDLEPNPGTCTYQAQYYPADPKKADLIEVGN